MGYSIQSDWEDAAGGAADLIEAFDFDGTNTLDTARIGRFAAEVDAWIDSFCRRQFPSLPFSPVPQAIRLLSAAEIVFRGREKRRLITQDDMQLHQEREAYLRDIMNGRVNPVEGDLYPIGDGGGTPVYKERGVDTDDSFALDSLKGFL